MTDLAMWALLGIAFLAGVTVGLSITAVARQLDDEDAIEEWRRFREACGE